MWIDFLTGSLQGTTRGWLEMACGEYPYTVQIANRDPLSQDLRVP